MGLIGRQILMYNEYIPAIIGDRDWKYQVLGHHDGMDVKEPLKFETSASFQKLFLTNMLIEGEQKDYATQVFVGMHDDDGLEEQYWNAEEPFTFVTLIQFREKNVIDYQQYLEGTEYKESELSCNRADDNPSIRAYYALDYNDMILIIKCRKCETGINLINNLHQNENGTHPFEVSSSYSILAIDRDYINIEEKNKTLSGSVQKVELRIIESYQGSVSLLYNNLKECIGESAQIKRYSLLGTDDEAIMIKNIPWSKFLGLYKKDCGFLCNSNGASQKYADAITTKLMYEINEKKGIEINRTQGERSFCKRLSDNIQCYYENKVSGAELAEKKTLMMIVNALGKFEYARNKSKSIVEYNIFTLYLPFYAFFELHKGSEEKSSDYYDFLTYFNICTQNFVKPDRIFSQAVDFNVRYFDMQTKYITFYSAYIYCLKNILNTDKENVYEFVLCPGMSERTEVKEFYKWAGDSKYRLMEVDISETMMYDIKAMLCILGHEVSHFVGKEIRSRDRRYQHMRRISSRIIVIAFQAYLKQMDYSDKCVCSSEWDNLEDQLVEWIEQYIARDEKVEYWEITTGLNYDDERGRKTIDDNIEYSRKCRKYSETMKEVFVIAIREMLRRQGKEIFDFVVWESLREEIEKKEIEKKERDDFIYENRVKLNRAIGYFIDENIGSDSFHLEYVIDIAIFLLKECYADLSSILALRMTLKEYLLTIIKEAINIGLGISELENSKILARIAIVMSVMHYKDEKTKENFWIWKQEDLVGENDSNEENYKELLWLQKCASDFMITYIENNAVLEPDKLQRDGQYIIYDNKILKEIICYLLYCREKFYKSVNDGKLEQINRFKEAADCSAASDFYEKLMKLLIEYENAIYTEISNMRMESSVKKDMQEENTDGNTIR